MPWSPVTELHGTLWAIGDDDRSSVIVTNRQKFVMLLSSLYLTLLSLPLPISSSFEQYATYTIEKYTLVILSVSKVGLFQASSLIS